MFSQTVEYALRAVMFVASTDGVPASSERISQQMRIPRAYLSKVMRGLVVSKIVESQLGPNGGFLMNRPINQITVLDVVNAVDPLARIKSCPLGRADHVKLCPLHREMDDAMHHVESRLRKITIAELQKQDIASGSLAIVNGQATPTTVKKKRRRRSSKEMVL